MLILTCEQLIFYASVILQVVFFYYENGHIKNFTLSLNTRVLSISLVLFLVVFLVIIMSYSELGLLSFQVTLVLGFILLSQWVATCLKDHCAHPLLLSSLSTLCTSHNAHLCDP